MDDVVPVRRALLSVSDKRGLIDLAHALAGQGVHLLASGGTRTALAEAGLGVTEVSAYTGQPEILGGRVKTLHPKLHGGILARRDVRDDLAALSAQGIEPIDLVVVNLYPFEETVARPGVSFEEAVENIDIGGPSLIRGAAKNHAHVAVVVDPDQYPALIEQLDTLGGTTEEFRRGLAAAVFERTARYDRMIADYFARVTSPPTMPAEHRPRTRTSSRPRSPRGSSGDRSSATARTRTSAPPSTSSPARPARTWPRPGSCTARSCRTTTCSTSTARSA